MKKTFYFLLLLVLIFFGYWFFLENISPPTSDKKEVESQIEDPKKGLREISFEDKKFLFLEQRIKEINNLKLIANFEEKNSAINLFQKHQCQFLANGGFYDQQDRPLGWFFVQGELLRKEIKSTLLNGFFFLDQQNKIMIENVLPQNPPIWGLQTGPILIFQGKPVQIKMAEDESARRMIVALSSEDEPFFLIITGADSLISGPLLVDLPLVIEKIGQELKIDFKAAINLDGGTASAFINQEKTIKEYTWIGSFFCLQKKN